MDHPARVPQPLGQYSFYKRVNILGFRIDSQRPRFQFRGDPPKLRIQGLCGFRRDDPLFAQHGRMGAAPGDVIKDKPLVHPNRRLEGEGFGFGFLRETSGPENAFCRTLFVVLFIVQ
ncbi:hypothetical protein FACS189496_2920 [Bacilli bacterium]|nr:hypothetical protein FACS189496_2920 [Bacilli bacterium]